MKNDAPNSTPSENSRRAPGTDLPLARYAEALATILHYRHEQSAEVVARLGLRPETWDAAEKAWTEILTCPGTRTDGAIALEFTSVFARTRKRLGLTKPKIAKLGPLPVAPPAVQALPALVRAAPEPPRAAELPSYLREGRPTSPPDRMSPPPAQYAATMALPIMRPDELIAPPLPAPPPPALASTRQEGNGSETAEVDVRCFRAAIPFSGTPTEPTFTPAPVFAPTPLEGGGTETAEVDVQYFRAPLPFSGAPAKPAVETLSPVPAGKRLVRFDPQTGEPLSSPRWADVPIVDGSVKKP